MSFKKALWFRMFCFYASSWLACSLENGLARVPIMGWVAWERFKCTTDCSNGDNNCISEQLFMDMADHIVDDGFKEAGYIYVNIDDCWMKPSREPSGRLLADPNRFPRGIKFLSNYVHEKGLKFGIYQGFGKYTCMGYPGIIGHMKEDAETFSKWDVDMLKLDGCHSHPMNMDKGYIEMGRYMKEAGKNMVYSCSWPYYQLHKAAIQPNFTLIAEHCNMWRIYEDIQDHWGNVQAVIDFFGDNQEILAKHSGPGHWNDPDMLVIGNFHMTYNQAQIHMAIWAMLAAPLLMSNDLRNISPEFREILLNQRVIAVDQDPLGKQGKRIYKKDGIEVWRRPITPVHKNNFSYALLIVSRRPGHGPVYVRFRLRQFGLNNTLGYHLQELLEGVDYGEVSVKKPIKIELKDIECSMLKAQVVF